MRCREAVTQLHLYLDKRLTLAEMRQLEQHVSSCQSCRLELAQLEQVLDELRELQFVAEPLNLAESIMLRVAMTPQGQVEQYSSPLRPSFAEILIVVVLGTIASMGIVLSQPTVRAVLPIANGHDQLSLIFSNFTHFLTTLDSGTLTVALWVIGTLLGVFITLIFAGNEMRTQWFKAVMERMPVR